jgi:ribosomal protein L11 methyltransferase
VISLIFAHIPATYDHLVEQLWAAGTSGIIDRETTLEAFFEDPQAAIRLAHLDPLNVIEADDTMDWEQYTKDSFPAVEVGARFFLAPPWSEDPTPTSRIRLVVNPGLACGTGYHPCTRLCLQALELHLKPGMKILDVGAGSGILSLAAAHLGAHPVACDIDPDAIPHCDTPHKFIGSATAVRSGSFDAIVANISAAANLELWRDYKRIVRASGVIILSGFEEEFDAPAPPADHLEQDGWHCYVFI